MWLRLRRGRGRKPTPTLARGGGGGCGGPWQLCGVEAPLQLRHSREGSLGEQSSVAQPIASTSSPCGLAQGHAGVLSRQANPALLI